VSIPQDPSHSVKLFMDLLTQEWPEYHSDNDQMIAASLALAHILGAVGAIALLKGGEERLNKMIAMVARNVENTAHQGVKALRSRDATTDALREGGPLSDDEVLRRIGLKGMMN
jgi:hypothetical protein